MKSRILYIVTVLLSLAACSKEDADMWGEGDDCPVPLALQVAADSFLPAGEGRSADSGLETTFTSGDALCVVITGGSGGSRTTDWVVYTYNGSGWVTSEAVYYDGECTYAAYYPYREVLYGKMLEEVKSLSVPRTDQRDYATGYAASDLMICEDARMRDGKLQVELKHRHSLIRLDVSRMEYQFNGKTYQCSLPVSGGTFTLDGKVYLPYWDKDNRLRLIVPPSSAALSFKGEYVVNDKKYAVTPVALLTPAANAGLSVSTVCVIGEYTVHPGDYYYSDGHVVPYNAVSPSNVGCIGVVFYAGKHSTDNCSYKDLDGRAFNDVKGYVAAIKQAGSMAWGPYQNHCVHLDDNDNLGNNSKSNYKGYTYTYDIVNYATGKNMALSDWPAANACINYSKYPAPVSSSGWFLPSVGQLSDMVNNRTLITNLNRMNGDTFGSSDFWSGSEYSESSAWGANYWDGSVDVGTDDKDYSGYYVCPVLAFY